MSDAAKIVSAVTAAVTTVAPLTGPAAPFVALGASAIAAIVDLAGPDKATLMRELAELRASTEAALRRKHQRMTPAYRAKIAQYMIHGQPGDELLAALAAVLHDLDAYENADRAIRADEPTGRTPLGERDR